MLVMASPYIQGLVESVKSLPYTERRYDGNRKVWFVDPKHGQKLVSWIQLYTGETVNLPLIQSISSEPVIKLVEVRYIGACKPRDDSTNVAFGLIGKDWGILFPEPVLRAWFDSEEPTAETPTNATLYQILGTKKTATADEIKTAFRRMAKQWHPDVCREPNAQEMFIKIQEASAILSDGNKRMRYDAGLKLQEIYEKQNKKVKSRLEILQSGYRSPLRCGLLMIEGVEKMGRLEVSRILAWEDIVKNGKTLVVSWPMGAKEPVEIWS